jgi:hypothetical protein
MNENEQLVLDAFERGKALGYAEGMKAMRHKELTDEEIRHIQAQCHLKDVGYDNFIMRFARAILLKAQEK